MYGKINCVIVSMLWLRWTFMHFYIVYSEYLTDIEVLCTNAGLTEGERDAVLSFARDNCDKLQTQAKGNVLLVSAFKKFRESNLYLNFLNYIKTPKSWNPDFDGENGIPY